MRLLSAKKAKYPSAGTLNSLNSPKEEGMRSMSADITVSKQRGRPFVAGVSGNPDGRPKGSRNKLTETFLDIVAKDFAENGAEAIERVRREDPVMYLRIVGSLITARTHLKARTGTRFRLRSID